MSRSTTTFVDTSVLPSDIFNYHEDKFCSIICQLAGSEEVELLKIQSIRTVHSFLRVESVFDVLTIDSEEIYPIKKQICFILNNSTHVIKPSIQGSIEYLRDLFSKKQIELLKRTKKKDSSIDNMSSTMNSATDAVSQNSATTITSIEVIDHRLFIIDTMNEWFSKNGSDSNLSNLKLVEGTDFFLTLPSFHKNTAHIRCACRSSSHLLRQGNHFQLSNYYRHLKQGKCSMLQEKLHLNNGHDGTTDDTVTCENSSQQSTVMERTQTLSSDSGGSCRAKRAKASSIRIHSKRKEF